MFGLMYRVTFEFCSTLAITSQLLETCPEKIMLRVNLPRTFQLVWQISKLIRGVIGIMGEVGCGSHL